MKRLTLIAALLLAGTAQAQQVEPGAGGVLRVLDKITGVVRDIEVPSGSAVQAGLLDIELTECRYPSGNPSGNAYGLLTIHYRDQDAPVFQGWMIASSPALNALDHPRYDVWVLRCVTG